MSKSNSKTVSIVMMITLVSKCFGFLRDIVLAYYFGAGSVTDAYLVAQTIPEFLFSLVVQAISIGYIPIYVEIVQNKTQADADAFTDKLMTLCLGLCAVTVTVVNLFGKQIVVAFASGFDEPTAMLATEFVSITAFALFTRICTSIWSCYLQAHKRFTVPALMGLVLDVVIIVSIIVAFYTSSVGLAYGLVFASTAQAIITFCVVHKTKPLYRFHKDFLHDQYIKKMLAMVIPVSIGVGANQINVLVDRTVASGFQGGVSALNYANKVDNVFENIIILSMATVLFPTFAEYASRQNYDAFRANLKKALNTVIVFMVPISLISMLFAPQIIEILFGRGQFDSIAIQQTSTSMRFYSIGLLFLSIHAILVRAFYAIQSVNVVMRNSCIAVIINVVLNFVLSKFIGLGGIALATSIANIYTAASLMILLHKKIDCRNIYKALFFNFLKVLFVSIIAVGIAYGSYMLFSMLTSFSVAFGGALLLSGLTYSVLALLLNVDGMKEVARIAYKKKT